jgi:hypothetical protein
MSQNAARTCKINKVTKTFRAGVGTGPYSAHITGSTSIDNQRMIRGAIIGLSAVRHRDKIAALESVCL